MTKKLGIIQSRGLGDIIIALPIAHYYHLEGYQIHWPVCREFIAHFKDHCPYINFHPVTTDQGTFFLDQPMKILTDLNVDEILPLYQALTGHKFHEEVYFQHTSFDQYKYIKAGVPFLNKWNLKNCISRDVEAEQELYNKLVKNPNYVVVHLEGSDHTAQFDSSIIPEDWDIIYITPEHTDSILNWLTVLERAQSIVCVDSCIANLVDQMRIEGDLYFIPRSHMGLTPVQGQHWTWLSK